MAGLCQHCGNRRIWYRRLSRNADTIMLPFSLHYVRFAVDLYLAAFALTLLACLFACRRERNDRTRRGNDRTRRGPMQRGATLPLPSRWPSTKSCSNTCGQPHWAPPRASIAAPSMKTVCSRYPSMRLTSESRLAFRKCAPDLLLAPNLHKGHHSPNHNTICFLSLLGVATRRA